MTVRLFFQAIIKGLILVGLLLFLPAGTFGYWQAWLLMGILFVPMFAAGIVMMFRSPGLLKKRLSAKGEVQADTLRLVSPYDVSIPRAARRRRRSS